MNKRIAALIPVEIDKNLTMTDESFGILRAIIRTKRKTIYVAMVSKLQLCESVIEQTNTGSAFIIENMPTDTKE